MGTAAGGLLIKKTEKSIQETINFIFGKDFEKVGYCDCRDSDCVYAGKINNNLAIINTDLSEKYFRESKIEDELFEFLEKPELIFVFEEYDSGASYGYGVFENGVKTRVIRASNYNDVYFEFGQPIEEEKEWLEGKIIDDTDGGKLLVNKKNKHEIPEVFRYKAILQLLMLNYFQFTCETMDDVFTSSEHFKKEEKIIYEKTEKTTKKWWKFW